jgi:hypothetical protein
MSTTTTTTTPKTSFTAFIMGIIALLIICAIIVATLPANTSINIGKQGIDLQREGAKTPETPVTTPAPSTALQTFSNEIDADIKAVYRLLNNELQAKGHHTAYVDTLTFVLLELTDIKTEKIDAIKGECNGDPECMKVKFAEKNAYIRDLARRHRIPIGK